MAPTAAATVFSTRRLTEAILSHLGMKDLAVIQWVSFAVWQVVTGSDELRRKLCLDFLEREPITSMVMYVCSFFNHFIPCIADRSKRHPEQAVVAKLNPLIGQVIRFDTPSERSDATERRMSIRAHVTVSELLRRATPSTTIGQLFVTRPPATRVEVYYKARVTGASGVVTRPKRVHKTLTNGRGVRLAELRRALKPGGKTHSGAELGIFEKGTVTLQIRKCVSPWVAQARDRETRAKSAA